MVFALKKINTQCALVNKISILAIDCGILSSMNCKTQIITTMKNILLLSFIGVLSACSNYKLDIQQGNLVTQASISKLQQGMTKQQVQALIGTPLLRDSFNKNRWDYVFYKGKESNVNNAKNITLFFRENQLINLSN
jgi:outer membrane protein assembly factor BamE